MLIEVLPDAHERKCTFIVAAFSPSCFLVCQYHILLLFLLRHVLPYIAASMPGFLFLGVLISSYVSLSSFLSFFPSFTAFRRDILLLLFLHYFPCIRASFFCLCFPTYLASLFSFIFSFSGCCSRVLPPFLALFSSLNYTSDRFFYLAWCIVSLLPFRFLPVPVPPSLSLSPPPLLSSPNATSSLSVPPAGAPRLRISRRVWDQSHFLRHWSACQISQDEWLPSRPSPPAPGGVS